MSQVTSPSLTCPHTYPPSCLECSASPSNDLRPQGLSISLSGSSILLSACRQPCRCPELWALALPHATHQQLSLTVSSPSQPLASTSPPTTGCSQHSSHRGPVFHPTATTGPQGLPQRRSHAANFRLQPLCDLGTHCLYFLISPPPSGCHKGLLVDTRPTWGLFQASLNKWHPQPYITPDLPLTCFSVPIAHRPQDSHTFLSLLALLAATSRWADGAWHTGGVHQLIHKHTHIPLAY